MRPKDISVYNLRTLCGAGVMCQCTVNKNYKNLLKKLLNTHKTVCISAYLPFQLWCRKCKKG